MPFFLDTHEMSQRFGSHVAEFSSLLDTNHLSHGSPADFFPFAETLEKNNSFRLDLSGLVKSIAQKEDGELLLTDMMSIIAAAVCGPSYADSSIDLTGPSNTLMEFLLGTGLWKQFGSPSPRPQRTESVAPAPAEPQLGKIEPPAEIKEPRQRSSAVPPVPVTPPVAGPAPTNSAERANLLDASSELRQTLTRLEINTLQVKLHLESIEQRINKIEPAAEGSAATTADLPFAEPLPRTGKKEPPVTEPVRGASVVSASKAETPKVETTTEDVLLPIDPPLFGSLSSSSRSRAVFSHPEPEPEYDNDFTAPTFGYGGEKSRSAIPIVIVILLALLVAAFFFLTRTDSGQSMLQSGKEHIAAIRSSANGNNSTHSQSASPPASSPPQKATSPPSATTPPSSTPSQSATTKNLSSASPSAAQSKNQPSDAESADASDEAAAEARHPNLRYVPANVMEGNLLAAPRPVYPQSARNARLEGIVALQATISRSGSVMTLHVIRGPRELRSAAIDAVRRWRYRPYEVDGHPVQVTTNIYVHFNLGPPPTLVR